MQLKNLVAFAASISAVAATYKGFNYGSYNPDGSVATQANYHRYFSAAKNLVGAPGFDSARLYTTIQAGTTNTPIEAIPAAIATKTKLLLGMWASGDSSTFDNELVALKSAIKQYGKPFTDLVAGISVGSEDLYRDTPIGIKNHAGVGQTPSVLVSYIHRVRSAIHGTHLGKARVGHVDTWTAWVNHSNHEVVKAVDFLGVDAYPYYENTKNNNIHRSLKIFDSAMKKMKKAAGHKPVWITETGWPVKGPKDGNAVASTKNAHTYWKKVACKYQDTHSLFWYDLFDHGASGPEFGVVGPKLSTKPRFDLKCPKKSHHKKHHKGHKKHHHKKHHHNKHHHDKHHHNKHHGTPVGMTQIDHKVVDSIPT